METAASHAGSRGVPRIPGGVPCDPMGSDMGSRGSSRGPMGLDMGPRGISRDPMGANYCGNPPWEPMRSRGMPWGLGLGARGIPWEVSCIMHVI